MPVTTALWSWLFSWGALDFFAFMGSVALMIGALFGAIFGIVALVRHVLGDWEDLTRGAGIRWPSAPDRPHPQRGANDSRTSE